MENIKMRGDAILESRDLDGNVLKRIEIHNIVVTTGLTQIAKLIGGDTSDFFNYMAIGTGTAGAALGNTALGTEVLREEADNAGSRYLTGNKIVFEHIFEVFSAETHEISEVGVFDQATLGGVMLDRIVCTALTLDAATPLYVKITLTVS